MQARQALYDDIYSEIAEAVSIQGGAQADANAGALLKEAEAVRAVQCDCGMPVTVHSVYI